MCLLCACYVLNIVQGTGSPALMERTVYCTAVTLDKSLHPLLGQAELGTVQVLTGTAP